MSKLLVKRRANAIEMRRARTRAKLIHSILPRLIVNRSNKHMFAQIVESGTGKAVVGIRGEEPEKLGMAIAKKAIELGIKKIVFDRGPYSYHGRVKKLADAAREGGLEF